MKLFIKGNAQFLFLCNAQKSGTSRVCITFPQITQKILTEDIVRWLELITEILSFLDIFSGDMVKHKLRVASYYLRVESLKARVKIQKCKFKFTSCEFKSSNSNSWVTGWTLRVTSSNPRVTSSNLRVTSSNPRVTSSNPRVPESFNRWKFK